MRTLRVTGKGHIQLKPDQIILMIKTEGIHQIYDEAIKMSVADCELLKDALEDIGFERQALKTVQFDISMENERYQTEDHAWRQRFIGYRYVHAFKLVFDLDHGLLGKVLSALSRCAVKPEIDIEYSVKDTAAAKNDLLRDAVQDAKTKAEVLSQAAGVNLLAIEQMDYSWSEIALTSRPIGQSLMRSCLAASDTAYDLDIEPDDIEATDTVTIEWQIA